MAQVLAGTVSVQVDGEYQEFAGGTVPPPEIAAQLGAHCFVDGEGADPAIAAVDALSIASAHVTAMVSGNQEREAECAGAFEVLVRLVNDTVDDNEAAAAEAATAPPSAPAPAAPAAPSGPVPVDPQIAALLAENERLKDEAAAAEAEQKAAEEEAKNAAPAKPISEMGKAELQNECDRLGITYAVSWAAPRLLSEIESHNAAQR